jgi:crotonobetainyl-CoA:carnitine CoA-transferase CaiB-like acyl-CoA transferase
MAKEKRDIEINSRADTLPLMGPEVRPWPVTPPPTPEECMKVYEKRKASEFGKFLEDNLRIDYSYDKPEALQGVRILCNGLWRMGNKFASGLMSELGAELINIEPPGGDPLRQLTPFGREEYMLKDAATGTPCGLDFIHELRNAHSITLNLETEDGRQIYKDMARNMDILIEEYPPGYMDSLGIGYRHLSKINPKLIYCWIGERGQWGPMKDEVSKHGQWMLEPFGSAANSWIANTGFPPDQCPRGGKGGDPMRSGVWLSDYVAGEQAANSILAALYWRDCLGNGEGQFIECTAAETMMDILDFDITWYGFNASVKARTGAWDPNLNQYEWNPCKDGYMMIGGQTDRLWYRIGMCIERDLPEFGRLIHEDPLLKEMAARNALQALIKTYTVTTKWLRDINRIEAETKLMEYEIAAGPILYIDEVSEFPHFKYRPWVNVIEDEQYGTILYSESTNAYQHRTPARVKSLGRPLGHDNGEIYKRYLGYGPMKLRELKAKGVI